MTSLVRLLRDQDVAMFTLPAAFLAGFWAVWMVCCKRMPFSASCVTAAIRLSTSCIAAQSGLGEALA